MTDPLAISENGDLRSQVEASPYRRITLAEIKARVCEHYHISPRVIVSPTRQRSVAWPRQVVMFLARRRTGLSMPQIARALGRVDHTTVLHGCRAVERRCADDPAYAATVELLEQAL